MKKIITLTLFLILTGSLLFSQELLKPNFALASHPLKIEKINRLDNSTIIELSIENKSENGYFCADKNIVLKDILNAKRYQLVQSEGIAICPDSYKFNYVGEVLTFKLYFPTLSESTKYIDIVENCQSNCFSINGIILSPEMNQNIDMAYSYYGEGKLDFALASFKMAVNENPDYPYGLFHYNIIQIYAEKKDFVSAKKWYNKILDSNFKDKYELIARLNSQVYYNSINN